MMIKETYSPEDISYGIFQQNYFKYPKFVDFRGSSYFNEERSNETVVLVNNTNNIWESRDKENSTFTITFREHKVKLSGFSILSCTVSNCAGHIEVDGSNDGFNFNYVCSVNKGASYFREKLNYANCSSSKYYKVLRLKHVGKGYSVNYRFPMYYLEIFGNLAKYFYKKECFCRGNNHIIISTVYTILMFYN